ncbi:MAG TPA: 3'-5' exonuclease, partial [Bacteroidetes bacterium]|nr:3'-5' exonuclease [Bacteroidota bacterium]
MRFEGGREVDRFSELVSVEGRIPPEIVRLTGITDSDLDGAPPVEELLPRFLEFLGADPLVGHNVSFDHGFLFAEIDRLPAAERPAWTPGPLHDTRLVARAFFPTLDSF